MVPPSSDELRALHAPEATVRNSRAGPTGDQLAPASMRGLGCRTRASRSPLPRFPFPNAADGLLSSVHPSGACIYCYFVISQAQCIRFRFHSRNLGPHIRQYECQVRTKQYVFSASYYMSRSVDSDPFPSQEDVRSRLIHERIPCPCGGVNPRCAPAACREL